MPLNVRKQLHNAAPKKLKGVFEVNTISALEDFVDPKMLEAIANLDTDSLQELTVLATETLLGRGSKSEFLKKLGGLVSKNYQDVVQKSLKNATEAYGVPFLFRGDLSGFTNATLDETFRNYLTRRAKKKPQIQECIRLGPNDNIKSGC